MRTDDMTTDDKIPCGRLHGIGGRLLATSVDFYCTKMRASSVFLRGSLVRRRGAVVGAGRLPPQAKVGYRIYFVSFEVERVHVDGKEDTVEEFL